MILAFLFGRGRNTQRCCRAQQHWTELPGRGRQQGSWWSKACSLQRFQPVNSAALLSPLPLPLWLLHCKKVREGILTSISVPPLPVLPPSPLLSVPHTFGKIWFYHWYHIDLLSDRCSVCGWHLPPCTQQVSVWQNWWCAIKHTIFLTIQETFWVSLHSPHPCPRISKGWSFSTQCVSVRSSSSNWQ